MVEINIKPELTAIHRNSPSYPLKKIIKTLNKSDFILDYGCGHGFDLQFLKEEGFNAKGYDKYIKKYSDLKDNDYDFDVINCFYVLNVISDNEERINVLKRIKELVKKDGIIYIAVRSIYEFKRHKKEYEKYSDGIITSRKTFQKYFEKEEIIDLIKDVFSDKNIEEIKGNKNTFLFKIN